ncbi:MAG TPA: nuclear transport factor 2 family protein [Flavitalea sp.]|nr:nuclear transport factor 2 family protein [Flavitalea sp.]
MKPILIMLTMAFYSLSLHAQSAEDSIKAAVNTLFDGMKNADGSLVSGSFSDSAVLQTITRNKEGKTVVRNEQVKDFAEFVSKQEKGAADERIHFETIKIDGPLAIAWTPYKFYYEGKFSHCGVNSFQLVRLDGHWKIQYLIDTRRRQGCEE